MPSKPVSWYQPPVRVLGAVRGVALDVAARQQERAERGDVAGGDAPGTSPGRPSQQRVEAAGRGPAHTCSKPFSMASGLAAMALSTSSLNRKWIGVGGLQGLFERHRPGRIRLVGPGRGPGAAVARTLEVVLDAVQIDRFGHTGRPLGEALHGVRTSRCLSAPTRHTTAAGTR